MPNPIQQGLMAARPQTPPVDDGIDALIQQRMGVNQAVSGQPTPPQMPPSGHSTYPGQPQGWHPPMAPGRMPAAPMDGLQQAAPEASFDEIMRRAQAIPTGGVR